MKKGLFLGDESEETQIETPPFETLAELKLKVEIAGADPRDR